MIGNVLKIRVKGARENNLKNVDVDFSDGLTVVTGVSGSGKTSLIFETLYNESRRRFQEVYEFGSANVQNWNRKIRGNNKNPLIHIADDHV